ncbi:endothelial cell-specific chemotaxis regulator isoform X6 [Podarcis raffonei]|uniref:endothelial cell-specific chemotaxis regulator isoform X6 n=1 Tax=Podarcis raffonei TaxID=65483 RepID=UPI00232940DE|nr:endothelial cell-specific chemotaxis regulator isoform X6 [Podarcis raffonei]
MIALHFLMFFWLCDSVLLQESVPKKNGSFIQPSSAEEKSAALTVAATDKQKPQHPIVSYSCSDAEAAVGKKNVMLVSMKDLNISNSQGAAKCITHEN